MYDKYKEDTMDKKLRLVPVNYIYTRLRASEIQRLWSTFTGNMPVYKKYRFTGKRFRVTLKESEMNHHHVEELAHFLASIHEGDRPFIIKLCSSEHVDVTIYIQSGGYTVYGDLY